MLYRFVFWLDIDATGAHPHIVGAVIGYTLACQLFVASLIELVHRFRPSAVRYPMSKLYPPGHLMVKTDRAYYPWPGYCFVFPASCSMVLFVLIAFLGPRFVFGLCPHMEVDDRGDRWVSQPLNCSLGTVDAINNVLRSITDAAPV